MIRKKFFCALFAVLMMLTASAGAADESANTRLARIETDTYGSEQSGALLDRISRLEKDFSGRNMAGNMNARIEAIYDTLYNNAAGPGVLAKINALEWNANHAVQGGGIGNRLTALENQIIGTTSPGTFNDRIRALAKASYGEEILPIAQVQIPAGTLIKVETTAPVSSKTLMEGDIIPVRVVEDVFVDGNLVFVRGLPGEGTVTRVVRAKHIFNNGKIETDFNVLKTIDGQDAVTCVAINAQEAMLAGNMARGLSLVGQTFSGKNKQLEEVLVRGKNIDLPAGVELYVELKNPLVVYGVSNSTEGLLISELTPVATTPAASTPATSTPATSMPNADVTIIEPDDTPPPSTPPTQPPVQTPPPQTPPQTPPPAQTPPPQTPPQTTEPAPLYDDEEIIEIIDED